MKIDLSAGELWDLLKEGSTNQKEFVNSLYYSEFEEFMDILEMEFPEMDLIGYLNGGVLVAEETSKINEDHCIFSNGRVTINLY